MKNYSSITENKDIITKEYADSNFMPFSGGTFTGDVTFSSGQAHLRTDLIKSADDSKWIAEFTSAGLEIGGSGTPLRFYSSTRPVIANQNKELAYTSDIPDISGLMPKSGGTFTGNISVPKELVFTNTTNPFIRMTTQGVDFYFQSTSGQFGLGPTWNKATHWDSNGNVTFPSVPKVGSTALVLTSSFSLSGTTLTITVE